MQPILCSGHAGWLPKPVMSDLTVFLTLTPDALLKFAGNYQEYEADKKKRLGEEGAKPKRIRYKPISR